MSHARAGAKDPVLIYGATGTVGALLARALLARGTRPVLAGRDARKLRALAASLGLADDSAVAVAALDEPSALARLVERARVVVGCAGPIGEVGEPLVAACAARGVHYVDSAGEAGFVRTVLRRYDATARDRGAALVPAAAFEAAVGDAAAARAAVGLGDGLSVELGYAFEALSTTAAMRAAMARAIEAGGLALDAGRVRSEPLAAHARAVPFAPPLGLRTAVSFPSPVVLTVPRHLPALSTRAFVAVRYAPLVRAAVRATAPLVPAAAPLLRQLLGRVDPLPPSRSALAATRFQLVATVRASDGARGARVTVTGSDLYGLSAALLAETALALVRTREPPRGFATASEILGLDAIFAQVLETIGGAVIQTAA